MKRDQKKSTVLKEALKDYPGEVRFQEPLASYTSLKIGGPADAMVFPKSIAEVSDLLRRIGAYELPFFVLGSGSNLLVKDGGIAGIVLNLKRMNRIAFQGAEVSAEAGLSYPKLAIEAMGKGLSGLEFAAGIPGTVGGAVAMNAGIPGEETVAVLKEIAHVDMEGEVRSYPKDALRFGYRNVALPNGVVVSAAFLLSPAPAAQIEEKMKQLLKRRRETQPLTYPNVGSVFKNPEGSFAGRLIEEAGLKGAISGEAQISEKHGNFIINRGGATARDVVALIKKAGRRIEQERGITLELEVKIVGRN
jgi:UDP-N-acetylmuramate dehydrogenase